MTTAKVTIVSKTSNKYAQVIRCCLGAINACKSTGDTKQKEQFIKLKAWANEQYDLAIAGNDQSV